MPALLNVQPGWALLLGGLVLLVAGLVLLWLARVQSPSDAVLPSLTPASPSLTFTPLFLDDPLVVTVEPTPALDIPRCYDTLNDTVMCLGLLKNTSQHLWKNMSLTLHINNQSQRTSLEQVYLLPGQTAPYRVLWTESVLHEEDAASIRLSPEVQNSHDDVVAVSILQTGGAWLGQTRYRVRGMLQNPTSQYLKHGQMVVTLLDAKGALVGYRLRDLPPLLPDTARPFLVDLAPVIYDPDLTPRVTALAWKS